MMMLGGGNDTIFGGSDNDVLSTNDSIWEMAA